MLGDLTQARVPVLLRQVIDERVARLSEEARDMLATAAVMGQEISLPLWVTVADMDEGTLLAIGWQAVEAHVLEETPDGTLRPLRPRIGA